MPRSRSSNGLAIMPANPPLGNMTSKEETVSGITQAGGEAIATVLVRKASLATPSTPEIIATLYGLTPGELRVLLAVFESDGMSDLAEVLGISEPTVRTHLRRLFEKTGAKRQADLVKLVAGFARSVS